MKELVLSKEEYHEYQNLIGFMFNFSNEQIDSLKDGKYIKQVLQYIPNLGIRMLADKKFMSDIIEDIKNPEPIKIA